MTITSKMAESPYLAVCFKGKKAGIAVYFRGSGALEYGSVWTYSDDLSAIAGVVYSYEPEAIIINKNSRETLRENLEDFPVFSIHSKEFEYNHSKMTVVELCFSGDAARAESSMDLQEEEVVCAIGGLLGYLMSSSGEMGRLRVHRITQRSLSGVYCDLRTLKSLQILKEDSHPSKIKNSGRPKEGFSLYGVLDNCITAQGKKTLKQWIFSPLCNLEEINFRLDSVGFYLENLELSQEVVRILKRVCDIPSLLKRFREFAAKPKDWHVLYSSMGSIFTMVSLFADFSSNEYYIDKLLGINLESVLSLHSALKNCMDFTNRETLSVLPGVSVELDILKNKEIELDKFLIELSDIEREQLSSLGLNVPRVSILHFPQLGFHIEISFRGENKPALDTEIMNKLSEYDFFYQFSSENCFYFKSNRTQSLDRRFGDLYTSTREAENTVIREFETDITDNYDILLEISFLLAEIDALISLALSANSYNLVRPTITESPQIQIINGSHILAEMCIGNFIPNDCDLDCRHKSAVITGPNCSGKSVYLKMIGTIVYMAHLGSYVPAETAEIGLCDKIFTWIVSPETIQMSSFAEELQKVSIALTNCTESSLLLIDEFGKGTNSLDGMSLFGALVAFLDHSNSPMTLLTTHFQELITHQLIRESDSVRFYTMEMAYSEQPVFLYKLIKGRPRGSYGFNCARLGGISNEVIKRAETIRLSFREKGEIRPICKTGRIQKAKEILSVFSRYRENQSPQEFFNKVENILKP